MGALGLILENLVDDTFQGNHSYELIYNELDIHF